MDAGAQGIDIGLATTPMLYFAAHTLCDSGIQVTGSHNPKDHNGFKMVLQGRAIYGDDIQSLRQTIESESWQPQSGGSVQTADVLPAYRQHIVSDIRLARPLKIVVDRQRRGRRFGPRHLPRHRLRSHRTIQRRRWQLSNHHPDPSKLETSKTSGASCARPMRNWGWPSTATAVAWASSPRTAM